jgi:hypothetical protein
VRHGGRMAEADVSSRTPSCCYLGSQTDQHQEGIFQIQVRCLEVLLDHTDPTDVP